MGLRNKEYSAEHNTRGYIVMERLFEIHESMYVKVQWHLFRERFGKILGMHLQGSL